jgi:hypothetical protein
MEVSAWGQKNGAILLLAQGASSSAILCRLDVNNSRRRNFSFSGLGDQRTF